MDNIVYLKLQLMIATMQQEPSFSITYLIHHLLQIYYILQKMFFCECMFV
jgi:hypothetical protein